MRFEHWDFCEMAALRLGAHGLGSYGGCNRKQAEEAEVKHGIQAHKGCWDTVECSLSQNESDMIASSEQGLFEVAEVRL